MSNIYSFSDTPEPRRCTMRSIRSKETNPEISLRKVLYHAGYRYRKNYKKLPGTPDIALTKYRIAIFIDSEFFHGKDWITVLKPRLEKGKHSDYWIPKIEKNQAHDDEVNKKLLALDWTVIRFWGNEAAKHPEDCLHTIQECIFDLAVSNISVLDNPEDPHLL